MSSAQQEAKPRKQKQHAEVLHDFDAEEDDGELPLEAGDDVVVVQNLGQGWFLGRTSSGSIGRSLPLL